MRKIFIEYGKASMGALTVLVVSAAAGIGLGFGGLLGISLFSLMGG